MGKSFIVTSTHERFFLFGGDYMQNWGCRGLMCKTHANGISQVSLPIACKSFFLVFMPGKSFPLRHSRTAVPSSGAPTLTSGTSILEVPHGKDFPYRIYTAPSGVFREEGPSYKKALWCFRPDWDFGRQVADSKPLMIDYLLIFTIHQIVSNNSKLLFLTLPSPLGHCNSYLWYPWATISWLRIHLYLFDSHQEMNPVSIKIFSYKIHICRAPNGLTTFHQ